MLTESHGIVISATRLEKINLARLTTAGANDFLVRIQKTKDLIDNANAAQRRVGVDAVQWRIGEFNSSDGRIVCSFENGQMFAQVYGYIMKYRGMYGETWSLDLTASHNCTLRLNSSPVESSECEVLDSNCKAEGIHLLSSAQ